jgi:hypothetical protein
MEPQDPRKYSINDFRDWDARGELVLNPKFQRRAVWSPKARSFLIDTILRQLPIPMIYVRQHLDLATKKTIREVVDGQQRLRAVLDYLKGSFVVSKTHHKEFAGKRFDDLDQETQKKFLRYCFAVDVLEGATDSEILNIFARINTYTVTLNDQEKLNAEYFGAFKQFAYSLAQDHLTFWRNNDILTDQAILRMGDARLTSELIAAMIDGLQDTGKPLKVQFYKKYDDQFPDSERLRKRFTSIIDEISSIFLGGLSGNAFSKAPLFYSLFCILYDAAYKLPRSPVTATNIQSGKYPNVATALLNLTLHLDAEDPPPRFASFVAACKQETNTIKTRTIRHRFFWNAIESVL